MAVGKNRAALEATRGHTFKIGVSIYAFGRTHAFGRTVFG